MAKLNIVLYEPEIPANTGNIGRTCVATGTKLHLIEPLGFSLSEKALKRAGMDYWSQLDVERYVNYEDFLQRNPGAKIYMATTKAKKIYSEASYEPDCYIMFGKESAGIPEEILVEHPEECVRIPMIGETRSLNLSNSVAIVLYEALRHNLVHRMKIIKAEKLVHEYIHRDEDNQVESIQTALNGVDIEIEKGQFVAILGHNGSGKSTLAKHMNAILEPSGGEMWVDGMDTSDEKHLWDIRQSAGMVFQNPDNQIIASVVEEDVGFGPENIGVPTDEIWERVEESLKAVGMLKFRSHSPNKLSGGQKQRVAIAGVMAMQPECIIFDEPTAMLDPNGRKEVLQAAHLLNRKKGVTVILITHYMEEVVDADRVFVMDKGKVVMQGTPRKIFSQVDELKRHRLDVPQITLLADELRQSGLPIPAGILTRAELVQELCKLGHR